MAQGGDRGKSPNRTGTLPRKRRVDAPAGKPGSKAVKGGPGRGAARGKHAPGWRAARKPA